MEQRDLGLVALTFVVGYAISALWITPGGVTGDDHAIPRVLGQPLERAKTALANAGFRSRFEGERPCPTTPRGSVLWQDPPPGMVAPPKGVRLNTPEMIRRHAPEIQRQATLTHAMPPGNITEITPEERQVLAACIADGAKPE